MQVERKVVLVAEDDAEIRHLVRERLEAAGYDTRLARTGLEAVNLLTGQRFAGLVLDIAMPELDGFGVLEAARRLPHRPPTLMLTARHGTAEVRRAIDLGASDYLTKPFSAQQFMSRIARLMTAPRERQMKVRFVN